MTPCGPYGSFCCGQDSAARACCNAGNNTLLVGGGEAICNETVTVYSTTTITSTATTTAISTTPAATCPNTEALEANLNTEGNARTALATVLGCALLGLAVLYWDWRAKKKIIKQRVMLPTALQMENRGKVRESGCFK